MANQAFAFSCVKHSMWFGLRQHNCEEQIMDHASCRCCARLSKVCLAVFVALMCLSPRSFPIGCEEILGVGFLPHVSSPWQGEDASLVRNSTVPKPRFWCKRPSLASFHQARCLAGFSSFACATLDLKVSHWYSFLPPLT